MDQEILLREKGFAQRPVSRNTSGNHDLFSSKGPSGCQGFADQYIHYGRLETGGNVVHRNAAVFFLKFTHQAQNGRFQSAERKVPGAFHAGAREGEGARIAIFGRLLDRRAARIRQV